MSPEIFQQVEILALIFLSLKFCRLFSIVTYPSAQAMDLAVNTSAEDTRRMIEEKIREIDQNPLVVQVAVQELGETYLVVYEGKILTVEAIIDNQVPHTDSRSELGTRELSNSLPSVEMLTLKLESMSDELCCTKMALEEQTRATSQTEELVELREALQKAKQKVKQVWQEKCEQSIVHEKQLEEKEQRIRELQRQLRSRPPLSTLARP